MSRRSSRTARRHPSKARPPKPPSPEHNLAPEQFRDLNREFYRADPTDYLKRRVRALIISVADVPALDAALREGITYRSTTIRETDDDAQDDREASEIYLAMESTNLLHHAAESLLRLYFAHAEQPPCPWLEISRRDKPGEFKDRVAQLHSRLADQQTIDSLRWVFFGNPSPEPLGIATTAEQWQTSTDGLVMLVGLLCAAVLDDAPVYNATKHGLAVVGGESGLELSAGADLTIATHGQGLTHLGVGPADETGQRRWHKTLTFVRSEANLALTEISSRHIRTLWDIARYRYLREPAGRFMIAQWSPAELSKIVEIGREGPIGFNGMTQVLAYYLDEAEPEDRDQ